MKRENNEARQLPQTSEPQDPKQQTKGNHHHSNYIRYGYSLQVALRMGGAAW